MSFRFNVVSVISVLVLAMVVLSGCAAQQPSGNQESKLRVVATFYPFYEITKNVGGDKIELSSVVPPSSGVEPHDYEPTPNDIINLNSADVFVTTGVEFAHFEENLIEGLDNEVAVIEAGEGVSQIEAVDALKEEDPDQLYDPHIWVSVKNVIKITNNIVHGLSEADPANIQYYRQNADNYIAKLTALDADFTAGLSDCNKDTVLTSHAAFGYLARDYSFTQIAILGLSADTEPTADQIIEIVDAAREKGIKYIFYEELVDPKVSQTIASEVGAQTLLLSPIEGVQSGSSETYLSLMRLNLQNLEVALECRS